MSDIVIGGLNSLWLVTAGYHGAPSSLALHIHVSPTDWYVPLTGVHSVDSDISGWVWDKRLLESESRISTRYDTFLGGQQYNLLEGTVLEQWQSGTMSGCEYAGLVHYRLGESLTWTPVLITGRYSLFHEHHTLYSDYSYCTLFDPADNVAGLMVHTYETDAVFGTVEVALYRRDEKFRIFKHLDFEFVAEFTGEISGAARLPTVTGGGALIPANMSGRKYEFIIDTSAGEVILNDDHQLAVGAFSASAGTPDVPVGDIGWVMEPKGLGNINGRDLYTTYFPLEPSTVIVKAVSPAAVITTWTETASLNFSTAADNHYMVDDDLGIVTMGGFQAPDLVLQTSVNGVIGTIVVFIDPETMSQYPDQGVIVIGTEEIAYYEKGRNSFLNCTRGFNGTGAAVHTAGDIVSHRQMGAGTTDELYIAYDAVPRISYEVTDHDRRSANKSSWLDVRPATNIEPQAVVQILPVDLNLASIELETDDPTLGGNVYGPVYYGTDVSRITARGKDAAGNVVEGVELTIEVISGSGRFGGGDNSYTNLTNTLGEIYALYNNPLDSSSVKLDVTAVTASGGNTLMTVAGVDFDANLDDIWIFQVLKHDPVSGTVGERFTIDAEGGAGMPWGLYYIDIDGLIDESFDEGTAVLLDSLSVKHTVGITRILYLQSSGIPYTRVYLDTIPLLGAAILVGETCWLLQPEAAQWDVALDNGARHILYEAVTDGSVVHPITMAVASGGSPVYMPLHPDVFSGTTLTFNGRVLPVPAPVDDTNNLGAYKIVAPALVSIQAHGTDPVSGRVIQSNIIRLQLTLPNWLVGVDTTGALPIPYGWKLITEVFNIGAGIGGANFLTINPAANNINQFAITGVI